MEFEAPFITDYMVRMRQAGYGEAMRMSVLQHAERIYEQMRKEDAEGTIPMYREKGYQRVERKKKKEAKKNNWSSKGGYIAPIMVLPTPNGELAEILRGVVEQEKQSGLKFKIMETGGVTIKSWLQKSNPFATPGCADTSCVPCKGDRGVGGNCRKSNIQYSMECGLCPD